METNQCYCVSNPSEFCRFCKQSLSRPAGDCGKNCHKMIMDDMMERILRDMKLNFRKKIYKVPRGDFDKRFGHLKNNQNNF